VHWLPAENNNEVQDKGSMLSLTRKHCVLHGSTMDAECGLAFAVPCK